MKKRKKHKHIPPSLTCLTNRWTNEQWTTEKKRMQFFSDLYITYNVMKIMGKNTDVAS